MNKKNVFIPGWMDKGEFHGYNNSLNIWVKKFDPKERIETEYVIGHSTGTLFALQNWDINRNTKLILVGALIPKRSLLGWFFRWIRFIFSEGTHIPLKRMKVLLHTFSGFLKLIDLIEIDPMPIIDSIPKEDLIIIRGKNDKYFFDEKISKRLKEKGVRIIEIHGSGHNFDEKIKNKIDEIINPGS